MEVRHVLASRSMRSILSPEVLFSSRSGGHRVGRLRRSSLGCRRMEAWSWSRPLLRSSSRGIAFELCAGSDGVSALELSCWQYSHLLTSNCWLEARRYRLFLDVVEG